MSTHRRRRLARAQALSRVSERPAPPPGQTALGAAAEARELLSALPDQLPEALARHRRAVFFGALSDAANPLSIMERFADDEAAAPAALLGSVAFYGGVMIAGWRLTGSLLGAFLVAFALALALALALAAVTRRVAPAEPSGADEEDALADASREVAGGFVDAIATAVHSMLTTATFIAAFIALLFGTSLTVLPALGLALAAATALSLGVAWSATWGTEHDLPDPDSELQEALDRIELLLIASDTALAEHAGPPEAPLWRPDRALTATSWSQLAAVSRDLKAECEARMSALAPRTHV